MNLLTRNFISLSDYFNDIEVKDKYIDIHQINHTSLAFTPDSDEYAHEMVFYTNEGYLHLTLDICSMTLSYNAIYVLPNYRGRGVNLSLMDQAIQYLFTTFGKINEVVADTTTFEGERSVRYFKNKILTCMQGRI